MPRPATRCRAASCRRGRSWCRPVASAVFPGGEFTLPCALIVRRLEPRASARQGQAQRHPARPRGLHVTHRSASSTSTPPISSVSPPRSSRCRRRATTRPSWPSSWRSGCSRAHRRSRSRRVGANVIARTQLGRDRRVVLGGHLDTVPANGNAVPRVDGDVLHGLGSADMKGGLAVLLAPRRGAARRSRPCPPRRDPRVLRVRGGRATSSTGCGASSRSSPRCSTATSRCCSSPPTPGSRRVARA